VDVSYPVPDRSTLFRQLSLVSSILQQLVNQRLPSAKPSPSEEQARRFVADSTFVWHQRFMIAPNVYTPGLNDIEWLLALAELPADLSGRTVLDVRTTNGGAAFELRRRGAERVLATDIVDEHWFGFAELRSFLGYEVGFQRTSIYESDFVGRERFDIVLFLGVLHHLRHPLLALDNLRQLIAGSGYIETAVADCEGPQFAGLSATRFYRNRELHGDPTNWFAPTVACLMDWCRSAGLEPELLSAWPEAAPQRCVLRVTPTDGEPEFIRLSYERPLYTTSATPPVREQAVPRVDPSHSIGQQFVAPPVPWTADYVTAHRRFVRSMLESVDVVRLFADHKKLPVGYGVGLDERVIEYLWLAAQPLAGRALDAGSALNHSHILDYILPRFGELHVFTKAPEDVQFAARGISYVFGDLRDLPYRDEYFHTVVSVSTIEHIGMDNRRYGVDEEPAADAKQQAALALLELRRVMAPQGQLLITVPFGRAENHGWFRQFSRVDVDALIRDLAPVESVVDVFQYFETGWQRSDLDSASAVHYRDFTSDPSLVADGAAAARAVVCIRMTF
jgi:SAM-dependent methyltransferase